MIIQMKIRYSAIVALVLFISSFLFNVIPCQFEPNVPNPELSWKMCNINPDFAIETAKATSGNTIYLGITGSLFQTYLIILGGVFIITFILLTLLSRKVNEGR